MAGRLEENARNGLTLKEALIKAIKETTNGIQRMSLQKGKKRNDDNGISMSNIISKKRRKQEERHVTFGKERETIFDEKDLNDSSKTTENVFNDQYDTRKISKNYSVSYDADEEDVGQMGSSDADSETTFGYSTRETVQKDGEDMEEDISDSKKKLQKIIPISIKNERLLLLKTSLKWSKIMRKPKAKVYRSMEKWLKIILSMELS